MTDDNTLKAVITEALNSAEVEIPEYNWPVIISKGSNDLGKCVRYTLQKCRTWYITAQTEQNYFQEKLYRTERRSQFHHGMLRL